MFSFFQKAKSAADDFQSITEHNWKLLLNGSTIIEKVENMVTKGETACFEQFLLLLPFFQKARSAADDFQKIPEHK